MTVTHLSTLTNCPVAPAGLTGGTASGSFTAPGVSCTTFGTVPNTDVYHWNTGASTTINYSSVVVNLETANELVQTGSVSAGQFFGDEAVDNFTLQNINLTACTTSTGLTSLSGPEELSIDSLA